MNTHKDVILNRLPPFAFNTTEKGGYDFVEPDLKVVDHQQRYDWNQAFMDFACNYEDTSIGHKYEEQLVENVLAGKMFLEILMDDLYNYKKPLFDAIVANPTSTMLSIEDAAKEIATKALNPDGFLVKSVKSIQIILRSTEKPISMRQISSIHVNTLVKIAGIVTGASNVKNRALSLCLVCRSCGDMLPQVTLKQGFESYALPRKCRNSEVAAAAGKPRCPLDPYFIRPESCECVDFQTLKLQEHPMDVPVGEMPRNIQLFTERFLTDRAVPGSHIIVTGVYSIKSYGKADQDNVMKVPYIRVLGMESDREAVGMGPSSFSEVSAGDIQLYKSIAKSGRALKMVVASLAPAIYGYEDMKKAIACALFGGSLKVLPDGLRRRGDINVLLFGDPGVAKSQLLKFAVKVSPIGVYASGKGSSAAGLTASINRDPHSGNFIVEGGAMVLADGGCVAIDEFDKMRSEDRVAIHEAMEQQTISIAKAGITTTLNSRCAVLAAANSVYGRWDESRGQENIDLMPTILSRFDMIFLVKDTHDPHRDATLAKHVMDIHCKSSDGSAQDIDNLDANQLSMSTLRGYIAYCRKNFGPRLTKEAAAKLNARFVSMRQEVMGRKTDEKGGAIKTKAETSGIPITIRQLEAIIRIAESLAKMEMLPYATEEHVDEALRLFSISTMSTALSGSLVGVDEMTRPEDFDAMQHIEKQIKHRFVVGTRVSEHQVVQDFMRQKFTAPQVKRVLAIMQRRGEIQYRLQRQVLYRIK